MAVASDAICKRQASTSVAACMTAIVLSSGGDLPSAEHSVKISAVSISILDSIRRYRDEAEHMSYDDLIAMDRGLHRFAVAILDHGFDKAFDQFRAEFPVCQ